MPISIRINLNRMKKGILSVFIICFNVCLATAQVRMNSAEIRMMEDSLHGRTTVGGYGNAY